MYCFHCLNILISVLTLSGVISHIAILLFSFIKPVSSVNLISEEKKSSISLKEMQQMIPRVTIGYYLKGNGFRSPKSTK